MGRKTFDSIGKPLPNRTSIIISRQKNLKIEDVISTYDSWLQCRNIIEEEIKTKIIPIFCDLDGVLGDFDGRFEHFTGMFPDEWMIIATQKFGEKIARQRFWELIDSTVGVRYWRGIPFTEDGKILWNYIKQYNPILLTAPSRNEVSIIGKKLWVQDHLGPNIPIEFRSAQTNCRTSHGCRSGCSKVRSRHRPHLRRMLQRCNFRVSPGRRGPLP